ncbi:MAG: NAD(P)-dependent oxidoreductase [Brucellaceae bacterium]|nr:NAD(P)-dependent oxidoreductase [Brucellaceae bacterium]
MDAGQLKDGVQAHRIEGARIEANFSDLHPPLSGHEALVAADRCYFCYDAPCTIACPTSIDIPLFIRQIATGNTTGAAKTIFDQNILGGMCARVCPTETLCEEACVREEAEGKPVQIGLLQRFATDAAMVDGRQFYARAASTGKTVAVVGAGPAGLACAHRLAMYGHAVTIYEARDKSGGLNEFGIAAYKSVDNFAAREVDYVLAIGGIEVRHGQKLGANLSLADLADSHDAVFVGAGLAHVNDLGGVEGADHAIDAVDFIAGLRQAGDKSSIPVGRRVVVIGGGMTAVDCAVQAKLLGAEEVTICYRRGQEHMNASRFEQDLAAEKGVVIRHWLKPVAIEADGDAVRSIELEYTRLDGNRLAGTGQTVRLAADQVFTAIGQALDDGGLDGVVSLEKGRIVVDAEGRTSSPKIWAGGDCTNSGDDLTVTAVSQGRDAAESIHRVLMG